MVDHGTYSRLTKVFSAIAVAALVVGNVIGWIADDETEFLSPWAATVLICWVVVGFATLLALLILALAAMGKMKRPRFSAAFIRVAALG